MSWTEVVIEIAREHAEALSDALMEAGALSVSVEDADEGTADEKPLFTITAADVAKYRARLSPGHLALFAKYPDYTMPVFPTHRSVGYPQAILDASKANVGKEFPLHLQLHRLAPSGTATFLGVFLDLSEQHGVQERLFRQAHYDALTQLPNRLLLRDRLQQCLQIRSCKSLSLTHTG